MLLFFLVGPFLQSTVASGNCAADQAPFPDMHGESYLSYAQLFTVEYHSTYKVIKYDPLLTKYNEQYHPDENLRGQNVPDLVLYQCGTVKPSSSHNGVTEGARFFEIPVKKITLPMTPPLRFVELLSASNTIEVLDLSYISSPCGQLIDVCEPGTHVYYRDDAWKPLARKTDVVFTNTYGTGWSDSEKDVFFDMSQDAGILHRAEWVKFVAMFYNKEKEAMDIFSEIEADYLALKKEAAELKMQSTKTIAWIALRSGQVRFFDSHFRRDVTEDAGARLLPMPQAAEEGCEFISNSDGTQTYECDATSEIEHIQALMARADMIIDETRAANHGPYSLIDFVENFQLQGSSTTLKAMTNEAVYRIDGTISDSGPTEKVGNAWYERLPTQPQELLSDVMKAVWGNQFQGTCASTYLRHLHSGETQKVLQHSDCPVYTSSGDMGCSELHAHLHEINKCATQSGKNDEQASEISSPEEASGSNMGSLTAGLVIGLAALVI